MKDNMTDIDGGWTNVFELLLKFKEAILYFFFDVLW